ncbi:MAG: methionyl-tRNA formyltransferase [Oscillospiraceae bacterium]|nr:methionyl-tRNA formyltransferase [Oscillospiraceae bacterium]
MRIVFMGTPDFAAKSLERLYNDGHDIAGVFTQADKPRNRGMKLSFSPVKELALAYNIPVFQPSTLKDGVAAGIIRELNCDLLALVAYGKILTKEIIEMPPYGSINIHGSILPKYRGASPIQHAILNGDTETGVTSQYIAKEMDAGDIILTKKTAIGENETSGELFLRLCIMGAELLSETVEAIEKGTAQRKPQNPNEVTYAPKLTREMSPIDWTKNAFEIKNKVRGLSPWPAATMELDGKTLKVFSVGISDNKEDIPPGSIISAGKAGLEIACADGTVLVREVQAPGGKRMSAADYLRGIRNCSEGIQNIYSSSSQCTAL